MRNRGSALLTALFIITIVAIVTTAMTTRLSIDIQRTSMIDSTDKIQLASQAVMFWAMDRLSDPKQPLHNLDTHGKVLKLPKSLQFLVPNLKLTGELYDLQARFNINNLYNNTYEGILFGLLSELQIGSGSFERKDQLDAILYWLKPIQPKDNHDTWYDRYARQTPPYFPSHLPMSNLSELRLVYGISARRYQKLEPYLCALPDTTPININTASQTLLLALGSEMKETDIASIISKRNQHPYKDLNTLTPLLNKYHIKPTVLTTESQYFLLITTASYADVMIKTYTKLSRIKDKTGLWNVSVLSQSINTP